MKNQKGNNYLTPQFKHKTSLNFKNKPTKISSSERKYQFIIPCIFSITEGFRLQSQSIFSRTVWSPSSIPAMDHLLGALSLCVDRPRGLLVVLEDPPSTTGVATKTDQRWIHPFDSGGSYGMHKCCLYLLLSYFERTRQVMKILM